MSVRGKPWPYGPRTQTEAPGSKRCMALVRLPASRTQSSKLPFCVGVEQIDMGASPIPSNDTCMNWPLQKENSSRICGFLTGCISLFKAGCLPAFFLSESYSTSSITWRGLISTGQKWKQAPQPVQPGCPKVSCVRMNLCENRFPNVSLRPALLPANRRGVSSSRSRKRSKFPRSQCSRQSAPAANSLDPGSPPSPKQELHRHRFFHCCWRPSSLRYWIKTFAANAAERIFPQSPAGKRRILGNT